MLMFFGYITKFDNKFCINTDKLVNVSCNVLSVVPKSVKGVDIARFFVEDVHDDIAVVHADPTAFACAFVTDGKLAEFFHCAFQMLKKCFYLWSGLTRAYDEIVGNVGHTCNFDNFDIQCGFVGKGFADALYSFVSDVLHIFSPMVVMF